MIEAQLQALVDFASRRRDLRFIITPLGEGYSGYTQSEMSEVWRRVHAERGLPSPFRFVRLHRSTNPDLT